MSRVARIWIKGVWDTLRGDPWWTETVERMARYDTDRVRGAGHYDSLTEIGRQPIREEMERLLVLVAEGRNL